MRFCDDHWGRLREKIDERGLSHLIAPDGATAVAQQKDQLQRASTSEEAITPANFDPLMSAHWAIANNVTETLGRVGTSPLLYLLADGPEDPVEGHEGRTWPRCPLCYLNLAHEISCTDERCTLDPVHGYDWMLDRAADDAQATAERIGSPASGVDG